MELAQNRILKKASFVIYDVKIWVLQIECYLLYTSLEQKLWPTNDSNEVCVTNLNECVFTLSQRDFNLQNAASKHSPFNKAVDRSGSVLPLLCRIQEVPRVAPA
jgi:hypothetical protein